MISLDAFARQLQPSRLGQSATAILLLCAFGSGASAHHKLAPIDVSGFTIFVPADDPAPVGTLTLTGDLGSKDGDLELSWTGAPTGEITDYEITQTDTSKTTNNSTTYAVGTVTSYTVTDLVNGQYTFTVRACNDPVPDDCSASSNAHTGVVSIASTVASVPSLTGGNADAGGSTGLSTDFPGIVAGSHDVGTAGDARYVIPLAASPGTRGMAPNLALSYSSHGGNGIVGRGWSVSGAGGGITRCVQTIAQDGAPRAVDYSGNDKFCLNGQRLELHSGTYGSAGSTYRTEIDSFAKITAVGTAGSGPASFEVLTKDGSKQYYGSTADSRIEANGPNSSEVATWLLAKVEDRYTNYLTYTYQEESSTHDDVRLLYIDYTGNTNESIDPYARVQFDYETNPNPIPHYADGTVSNQYKRLSGIKMQVDVTPETAGVVLTDVREYVLDYDTTPNPMGMSRLSSVNVCAPNASGTCAEETTFSWQGETGNYTTGTWAGQTPETATGSINRWVDLNGDGRMDYVTSAPTSATHKVSLSTGAGYTTGSWTAYARGTSDFETFADLNGDGLADHITTDTGGTHKVSLSNGAGYDKASGGAWTAHATTGSSIQQFADMDGDGRPDYIVTVGTSHYISFSEGDGYRLESGSVRYQTWTGPDLSGSVVHSFHDANGDGRTDLVVINGTTFEHEVYINTGSGYATMISYSAHSSSTDDGQWGDLNGDGLMDYITVPSTGSTHYVSIWKGDGYATADWTNAHAPGSSGATHFLDMNGDGLTDYVTFDETGGTDGKQYISFSTGNNYKATVDEWTGPTFNGTSGIYEFVDLDGDGKLDFAILGDGVGTQKVGISDCEPIHLMKQVTDGLDVVTDFTYLPLADSSVYTKGDLTSEYGEDYDAYPVLDVVNPVHVVSQVDHDDGIGGDLTATYHYEGFRFDREGRGSLGFAKVAVTDLDRKTRVESEFFQGFPLTGLVSHTELIVTDKNDDGTTGDEQLMTESTSTYVEQTSTDGYPFVCPDTETRKLYELTDEGNDPISTTVTDNDPDSTGTPCDGYGNIATTTVTVTDHTDSDKTYTTESVRTLTNNTTDWLLGQIDNVTVKQLVGGTGDSTKDRKTAFTYTTEGALYTAVREPDGSAPEKLTTTFGYDDFGNRTSESVSATDITTRAESVAYDNRGRFATTLTNAESHASTLEYDERFGTVDRIEGANYDGGSGVPATVRTFDVFGRLTQEDRPDGTHAVLSYKSVNHGSSPVGIADRPEAAIMVETLVVDDVSSPTMQFTPVRSFLDKHGREVRQRVRGFDGTKFLNTDTVYDNRGRVAKTSNPYYDEITPNIRWSTPAYDVLNRTVGVEAADATANTTTVYDNFNVTLTDAAGRMQIQMRNALGQVLRSYEDEPGGIGYLALTEFEYDKAGNVVGIVKLDASEAAITKTEVTNAYDRLGRRTQIVDPDAGQVDFTYYSTGELKTQQTPRLAAESAFLTMTYDKLGRPITRAEPNDTFTGTVTTTWTYDSTTGGNAGIGQLTSETMTGAPTRAYFYDPAEAGKLTETTTTISATDYVVGLSYDALGRVATVNYPDSPSYTSSPFAVTYSYNPRGYLERVEDGATSAVFYQATAVNAEGLITAEYLGDGSLTNQGFAPGSGRLVYTNAARPDGGAGTEHIQNFAYTYDVIGNMQSRSDLLAGLKETFEYDALNRLTKATVDDSTTTTVADYDYDGLGNLTDKDDMHALSTVSNAFKYDQTGSVGPHAVTKLDTGSGTINFAYDANGNMTSGDPAGATRTMTYTSYDKALKVTKGSVVREFSYGADRSRYQQIHNDGSVVTTKTYIGGLYTLETNDTTSTEVHKHTVFANGQAVAIHVDTDDGTPATETKYLHRDHLGSITSIVDDSGIESLSYDPFGHRRDATDWVNLPSSTPSEDRGYTGHEHLDDVGIIHMNGRTYDPTLGRMLSPDPIVQSPMSSQNWNRYSYVLNNPLKFTDPSGYATCLIYAESGPYTNDGGGWGYGSCNAGKVELQGSILQGAAFISGEPKLYDDSYSAEYRANAYDAAKDYADSHDRSGVQKALPPGTSWPGIAQNEYWFDVFTPGYGSFSRARILVPDCYFGGGCAVAPVNPTPPPTIPPSGGGTNPPPSSPPTDMQAPTPVPPPLPVAASRAGGGGLANWGGSAIASAQDYLVRRNCTGCGLAYAGLTGLYETFVVDALDGIDDFRAGDYRGSIVSLGMVLFKPAKALRVVPNRSVGAAATRIPGRVQSRINISNDGFSDVLRKHFQGGSNKSQFSISEGELRGILSDRNVVRSPVDILTSGQFVRQIDVGRTIGNLPRNAGGAATSKLTIISDEAGNLINSFPGPLRF